MFKSLAPSRLRANFTETYQRNALATLNWLYYNVKGPHKIFWRKWRGWPLHSSAMQWLKYRSFIIVMNYFRPYGRYLLWYYDGKLMYPFYINSFLCFLFKRIEEHLLAKLALLPTLGMVISSITSIVRVQTNLWKRHLAKSGKCN